MGLTPQTSSLDNETLLADWGVVVRKLRRVPTVKEYAIHGKYSTGTYQNRFGRWGFVPNAFRAFAVRKPQWKRALNYLANSTPARRVQPFVCPVASQARLKRGRTHAKRKRTRMRPLRHWRRPQRIRSRPVCGAPLECRGPLWFAPTSEQGVVLLFGKLAERLGFFVMGLQTAFPDCTAMRRISPGNWQIVTIEFEFESKNFRQHRHDPAGCDIIVCWEHNWSDCPENLKVIALSEYVTALQLSSFENGGAEKSDELRGRKFAVDGAEG